MRKYGTRKATEERKVQFFLEPMIDAFLCFLSRYY